MKSILTNRMATGHAERDLSPAKNAATDLIVDAWWSNAIESIPALRQSAVYDALRPHLDALKNALQKS
jgi:hypothetical protein